MIKIAEPEVYGWHHAVTGARNALKSWDRMDSDFTDPMSPKIGPNDLGLLKMLMITSPERKYMRMIHVQLKLTAPWYFWKQYDTYKVATTSNSESTMHKIHASELTINDFSTEGLEDAVLMKGGTVKGIEYDTEVTSVTAMDQMESVVELCEVLRKKYLETKDKAYWKALIKLLPSNFNQMRTLDLNYETLLSIYFFRYNHKLDEWHEFCDWILTLPYMKEFIKAKASMSLQLYANRTGFWVVNRLGDDIRVYADDPSKGGHFLPIPECIKPLLNYKETTETKIYRPHVIQI